MLNLGVPFNLTKLAEFHGVPWLDLNHLARSLHPELMLGEILSINLAKPGKEDGQAVGYLSDGSMVVVEGGREHIGKRVQAEVTSVLPTAGGKMVFARFAAETA